MLSLCLHLRGCVAYWVVICTRWMWHRYQSCDPEIVFVWAHDKKIVLFPAALARSSLFTNALGPFDHSLLYAWLLERGIYSYPFGVPVQCMKVVASVMTSAWLPASIIFYVQADLRTYTPYAPKVEQFKFSNCCHTGFCMPLFERNEKKERSF